MQGLYVCVETQKEEDSAAIQEELGERLRKQYRGMGTVVEVTPCRFYGQQESPNIQLELLRHAEAGAQKHSAALSVRVARLAAGGKLKNNAKTEHSLLFIAATSASGAGDCIYTPIETRPGLPDSLGDTVKYLEGQRDEFEKVFTIDAETAKLTRFILSVLQSESIAAVKH